MNFMLTAAVLNPIIGSVDSLTLHDSGYTTRLGANKKLVPKTLPCCSSRFLILGVYI
jgi:hypothetical protein